MEPRHLPDRVLNPYSAPGAIPSAGSNGVIDGPLFLSSSTDGVSADPDVVPLGFTPGTDTMEGLEEKLIRAVLERAGGNKSEAARMLGISRFALLRRLEKLGPGH